MTTTEKLTRLLKIEAEATKGPWKGESFVFVYGEGDSPVCHAESSDDRNLIIASRNALRPMVTALEAAIEVIRDVSTGDDIRYESPEDDSDRILARRMESRADDARTTLARIESILAEIP